MQQARPEWKAIAFPTSGQSLAYARGESLTVETTALAVLAMLKSGQFPNDVNKALVYLVKSKDAGGTWGSTSATILSLKALIRAAGGTPAEGDGDVHDRGQRQGGGEGRDHGEERRRDAGVRPEGLRASRAPTRWPST